MKRKRCLGECGKLLTVDKFYSCKTRTGGAYHAKKCRRCSRKQKDQLLISKYGSLRGYDLYRLYKMTMEDFENLLKSQNEVCKICKENPATHVDHDHETGLVRGLLCNNCNSGLGFFKDDKNLLKKALKYLS